MDRESFLNLAPEYYVLALYIHLQRSTEYYTETGWIKDFSHYDEGADASINYVENAALREEAVRLMEKHGAIRVIHDPFGPTIWQTTEQLEELSDSLERNPSSVFFRASASGDPRGWLQEALQKLNVTADELKVTKDDFIAEAMSDFAVRALRSGKEPEEDEWAPITLDQASPAVAEATKKLSAATDAIEQDNGYSVTHPQERDAVVQDLKGGLEKFKSGVVSIGWLRRTAFALKTAGMRFANTVKGQVIDGALMAIKEMVKKHASTALEYLWSLLP